MEKPSDPVAFVRQHFKRASDEATDSPRRRINNSDASDLIQKQEHELNMARHEIVKLRQMLNAMSSNA